jgi:hypothetical protein
VWREVGACAADSREPRNDETAGNPARAQECNKLTTRRRQAIRRPLPAVERRPSEKSIDRSGSSSVERGGRPSGSTRANADRQPHHADSWIPAIPTHTVVRRRSPSTRTSGIVSSRRRDTRPDGVFAAARRNQAKKVGLYWTWNSYGKVRIL